MGIISLDNFKHYKVKCSCPSDGVQGSDSRPDTTHFGSSYSDSCPGDQATSRPSSQPCCRHSTGLGTSGSGGSTELMGNPTSLSNTALLGSDTQPSPERPQHPRTAPRTHRTLLHLGRHPPIQLQGQPTPKWKLRHFTSRGFTTTSWEVWEGFTLL